MGQNLYRFRDGIAKDAKCLIAINEDSDQTARMRRLIRIFVGRTSEGTFSDTAAHLFSRHQGVAFQ